MADTVKPDVKIARIPGLDAETITFENGLVVNLKKTSFQENSFQFVAAFGSGALNEPRPGMAMVAERVVNGSGSGHLTLSDLETIVAGSSIEMHLRIGDSVNYWSGSGLNKDFDKFVQLLQTMLLDVGFRENAFSTVMAGVESMYKRINHDIGGAMPLTVQPFLAGYNPRFGLPKWEGISKITYKELQNWVSSALQVDSLEISVVGDFDKEEVIKKIGQYFSTLQLVGNENPKSPQIVFPAGEDLTVLVDTSIEKSLVAIAWPTCDFWDISRTRRLSLLADILEDRVRKVVREKLGATYSPSVSSMNSRVYREYGYIFAYLIVKPGTENVIIDEIIKISDDLAIGGVTKDELDRALKPTLATLQDRMQTNNYWLNSVLFNSTRFPQQLEYPLDLIEDYSSITVEQLDKLASEYLKQGKNAKIKAQPSTIKNS